MGISLADHFDRLPSAELQRLQKQLRIILKNTADRDRLRSSIARAYSNLGKPFDLFKKGSLIKILDSFGRMKKEQMTAEEEKNLRAHPYTVWPDDSHCVISMEALEVLSSEAQIKKEGFLFAHIFALPSREKKAFARWLEIEEAASDRQKARQIYTRIAEKRSDMALVEENVDFSSSIHEELLRNIEENPDLASCFPDDPSSCPVAWFYRGVLPFYDCLSQMEKQTDKLTLEQKHTIALFKEGQVFIYSEPPEFGQPLRWKLRLTRERYASGKFERAAAVEVKESSLF